MVQILQKFPSFLRHPDITPECKIFSERYAFVSTVQGMLQSPSDADMLAQFSDTLRNDAELVLHALRVLNGPYRSPEDASFVGQRLCDDKEFCLRVSEELSTTATTTTPELPELKPRERLLRLTDLSDRLQQDPAVVVAFCRLDEGTFALAPEAMRRDCAVVRAACEAHPIAIAHALPCRARRDLESSVPFVIRLKTESAFTEQVKNCYSGLCCNIQEDRDVAMAAIMASHTLLVHRRWKGNVELGCDAVRQTTDSNLHRCYEQIPPAMQDNPDILNAVVQHPCFDKLCFDDHSTKVGVPLKLEGRLHCNLKELLLVVSKQM